MTKKYFALGKIVQCELTGDGTKATLTFPPPKLRGCTLLFAGNVPNEGETAQAQVLHPNNQNLMVPCEIEVLPGKVVCLVNPSTGIIDDLCRFVGVPLDTDILGKPKIVILASRPTDTHGGDHETSHHSASEVPPSGIRAQA